MIETTFEKALRVFGHLNQAIKTNEELNELGIEITRFAIDDKRFDRVKVLEEITDVEIMLKQLKLMFNFTDDELLAMKAKKILKLEMAVEAAENRR